jgi:uncharacterized protein
MNYQTKYLKDNMILQKRKQPTLCRPLICLLLLTNIGFANYLFQKKKPDFQTSVYDYAKVLSTSEKTQLEEN